MKPFTRFRRIVAVAALVLPLAVGGCSFVSNTTDMAPDIDKRFPYELSSSITAVRLTERCWL